MKKLMISILSFVALCFISCGNDEPSEPANNNEIKAIVIIPTGGSVKIDATGAKAVIGCSLFGGGTFVGGTNASNRAVYLNIYDFNNGSGCIYQPGTYSFLCEYRYNVADQNTPIYSNYLGDNHGSITITKITDHYMEGFFNATCKCSSNGCTYGVDSVVVSGSFKGNHFQ